MCLECKHIKIILTQFSSLFKVEASVCFLFIKIIIKIVESSYYQQIAAVICKLSAVTCSKLQNLLLLSCKGPSSPGLNTAGSRGCQEQWGPSLYLPTPHGSSGAALVLSCPSFPMVQIFVFYTWHDKGAFQECVQVQLPIISIDFLLLCFIKIIC